MKKLKSVTHTCPSGSSEYCCSLEKILWSSYLQWQWDPCMALSTPHTQAQQNDVARHFPLQFELQTMHRISKNIFRKLISGQFWTYLKFLSSPTLSWIKPVKKIVTLIWRFYCSENRFLSCQNHSDQSRYFRWVFSAQGDPRQNLKICPELSRNELFEYIFKNLNFVCGPNGNVKHPAVSILEKDKIVFNLATIIQCERGT